MTPNVSTVIFAIADGLRLYSAGKRVYVKKTLARSMPLPLLSGVKVNRLSAKRWFRGEIGQAIVKENHRIALLLKKTSLNPVEESELIELYVAAFLQFETELPDEFRLAPGPSIEEVQSFITIR